MAADSTKAASRPAATRRQWGQQESGELAALRTSGCHCVGGVWRPHRLVGPAVWSGLLQFGTLPVIMVAFSSGVRTLLSIVRQRSV